MNLKAMNSKQNRMNPSNVGYLLSFLFSMMVLTSCEEKIEIELDKGTPQLTVDAWITDKAGSQTIVLTQSADYFNNAPSPAVTNATVWISDDLGNIYNFIDNGNTGVYTWTPGPFDTLARVGHSYKLEINYGVETFVSEATMQPSVVIDSLTQYKELDGFSTDSVIRAEFWARDNFGREDFYWIRTYRDGTFNNKPNGILTAEEAAFGSGDGFIFIVPYRQGINEFDRPFEIGELVKVEIYGINRESFRFLNQAQSQMLNGGLFATPPYNVISNIKNANPNAKNVSQQAVGWFEVCGTSFIQTVIK
jgi:hypothetical protein